MTFESDVTRRLVAQVDRIGSPFLGLIPDCGIFACSIPEFRLVGARAAGIPQPLIEQAVAAWHASQLLNEVLPKLRARGLRDDQIIPIEMFFGTLGNSDPRHMLDVMPHICHVHGKYFSLVNGEEPNVRYPEIMQTLVDGGFSG